MAMWFIGNGVANGISGLLAYGIGHAKSSIAPWRLLFLVLGAITCAWGFLLVFLLPDSPSKARFLTADEKRIALHRVLENRTGVMDEDNYKPHQILEALKDPQAWFLALYTLSVNIPNGGTTAVSLAFYHFRSNTIQMLTSYQFSSIIVNGFGFSPLTSLVVQVPNGAFQLSGLAIMSITITKFSNARIPMMILMVTTSLIGMILVYTLPTDNRFGRLSGIWLSAVFAADIPISLSLITSNVGGFTKKATVQAMLFIGYCTGNIIGPQFFYTREAPKYPVSNRSRPAEGSCTDI